MRRFGRVSGPGVLGGGLVLEISEYWVWGMGNWDGELGKL